jgi:hypothetical protein
MVGKFFVNLLKDFMGYPDTDNKHEEAVWRGFSYCFKDRIEAIDPMCWTNLDQMWNIIRGSPDVEQFNGFRKVMAASLIKLREAEHLLSVKEGADLQCKQKLDELKYTGLFVIDFTPMEQRLKEARETWLKRQEMLNGEETTLKTKEKTLLEKLSDKEHELLDKLEEIKQVRKDEARALFQKKEMDIKERAQEAKTKWLVEEKNKVAHPTKVNLYVLLHHNDLPFMMELLAKKLSDICNVFSWKEGNELLQPAVLLQCVKVDTRIDHEQPIESRKFYDLTAPQVIAMTAMILMQKYRLV